MELVHQDVANAVVQRQRQFGGRVAVLQGAPGGHGELREVDAATGLKGRVQVLVREGQRAGNGLQRRAARRWRIRGGQHAELVQRSSEPHLRQCLHRGFGETLLVVEPSRETRRRIKAGARRPVFAEQHVRQVPPTFRHLQTEPRSLQLLRGEGTQRFQIAAQRRWHVGAQTVGYRSPQPRNASRDRSRHPLRRFRHRGHRGHPLIALAQGVDDEGPRIGRVVVEQGDEVRNQARVRAAAGDPLEQPPRRFVVERRAVLRDVLGAESAGYRQTPSQTQREAVDGLDLEPVRAAVQVPPAALVDSADGRIVAQRLQHAHAHLGRRLGGEGDGENLFGTRYPLQQFQIPRHQQARLAGTGRRLDQKRPRGVHGAPPRRRVFRFRSDHRCGRRRANGSGRRWPA